MSQKNGIRNHLASVATRCSTADCMAPASFICDLQLFAGEKGELGPLVLPTKVRLCHECQKEATPEKVVGEEMWTGLLELWAKDPNALLPVREFTQLSFRPFIEVARS